MRLFKKPQHVSESAPGIRPGFSVEKDTIVELYFDSWEERLPWVKKYRSLLSQPNITAQDCDVLPKMRREALDTHEFWADKEKQSDKPLSKAAIHEKYQIAVYNIVTQFCEPIESRYKQIVDNLAEKDRAAQKDDHELFTDALMEECGDAALVRYKARHNREYNPKSSARTFALGAQGPANETEAKEKAKARYLAEKDNVRGRFLAKLREENRALQDKFSELSVVITTLAENYATNNNLILDLKKEVRDLTGKLSSDIDELTPVPDGEMTNPTGFVAPAPTIFGAPPPPPLPPTLLLANVQSGGSPLMSLSRVKLKPRPAQNPHSPAQGERANPYAQLLGSSPARTTLNAEQKTLSSLQELESLLYRNAISIINKELLIAAMHEREKQQKSMIVALKRQKATLIDLEQQLQFRLTRQELLNQELISVSENTLIPQPPPPPPLPIAGFPSIARGAATVNLSSTQPLAGPASRSSSLSNTDKKEPWLADLRIKLANRRSAEDEEDASDDESLFVDKDRQ